MNTYRYRLRFFTHAKGVIKHDERKYELILPDGRKAELSCLDSESIGEGKELVLSGGGYSTEKEAFQTGMALKASLLLTGAKLRIGVDAGKEKASGWLNPAIKENIFKSHGVKIISDVHGVSVYSEEHPVKTISTSGVGLVCPSDTERFSSELCELIAASGSLTKKQTLALELYGASHFEKSDRARFLTLVLGVEALLDPENRSDKEVELVDSLIKSVKYSDLGDKEKQSILGSLRWLYKDSISQSLRKIAEAYLKGKTYEGHSPTKFITKCYGARSKLVHKGTVDESEVNIGILAANLNVFLSDLVQALIEKKAPKKAGQEGQPSAGFVCAEYHKPHTATACLLPAALGSEISEDKLNNEMKLFVNRQASLLASDACEAIDKMLETNNCSHAKSVDVCFYERGFTVDIKIESNLYDQMMKKAESTEMLILLREKAINFAAYLIASHELIIESVHVQSGSMIYQKELIVRMGFPKKPV